MHGPRLIRAEGESTPPNTPAFELLKPTIDVGLVVGDIAASRAFYAGIVGMKELPPLDTPDGAKMHRFQSGTSTIKLLAYPTPPPQNPGGINAEVGIRLLTLTMADLDPIAAAVAATGKPKPAILGKVKGQRILFIFDPDGNQVELLESAPDAPAKASDRATVGLTVADVEKSREFYGKILGLKEQPSRPLFGSAGPTKYTFEAGQSIIKFWSMDKPLPSHTGKWDAALGLRYITFLVKDVDAAKEELVKRGATIAMEPFDFAGVVRAMFLSDPDGNYIELASIKRKQ